MSARDTGPSRPLYYWQAGLKKPLRELALLHRHGLFDIVSGRIPSVTNSTRILDAKVKRYEDTPSKFPKARVEALKNLARARDLVKRYANDAERAYTGAKNLERVKQVHAEHRWMNAARANALRNAAIARIRREANAGPIRVRREANAANQARWRQQNLAARQALRVQGDGTKSTRGGFSGALNDYLQRLVFR